MKNQCFSNNNTQIVQFSKLDENNKAQFLQFLIKNNISFDNETGKQNFIAKVTFKTNNNLKKKQIHQNKINKNQNNKENKQISNQSKPNRSPLKQVSNNNNKVFKNKNNKTKIINSDKKNSNDKSSQIFIMKSNKQIFLNNQKQKSILKKQKQNKQSKTPQKPFKILKTSPIKDQSHNKKIDTVYNVNQQNSLSNRQKRNITPKSNKQNSPFINSMKIRNLDQNQNQNHKENIKKQKIRDKTPNKYNNQFQDINLSKKKHAFKYQQTESNQQQIIHSESQDRIFLVNKYSGYFNFPIQYISSNPSKQRPICWSLKQIQKFLDQFYDQSFTKNTHQILIGSKKLNQSLKKKQKKKKFYYIVETLQKHLNTKFNKVQKIIEYNLVNLLYSVAYYIYQFKGKQNQQNISIIGIKLFQNFLTLKFQFEDYLFFLFVRNILKNDFKKTFIHCQNNMVHNGENQQNKNAIKQNIVNQKSIVNKKQITKILKHIIGQGNTQILYQYNQMIHQKTQATQFLQLNKFLKIIVDDYQIKRLAAQQSFRQKVKNQKIAKQTLRFNKQEQEISQNEFLSIQDQQSSMESTFTKILNIGYSKDQKNLNFNSNTNIIAEDSMEQLTFGQDTKQLLKLQENLNENLMLQQSNFWSCTTKNHQNMKTQAQKLISDELFQIIAQKLYKKTHQLIQLLSNNGQNFSNKKIQNNPFDGQTQQFLQSNELKNQHIQKIEQILFRKSINLFMTVIQMNKVKWLKQLQIINPTQQDIENVQQIQLLFRKIKEYPSAKDIAEFCKLILTIKQITQELSKFFI